MQLDSGWCTWDVMEECVWARCAHVHVYVCVHACGCVGISHGLLTQAQLFTAKIQILAPMLLTVWQVG